MLGPVSLLKVVPHHTLIGNLFRKLCTVISWGLIIWRPGMCVVCSIHSTMNELYFMSEHSQRAWLQVSNDAPAKL